MLAGLLTTSGLAATKRPPSSTLGPPPAVPVDGRSYFGWTMRNWDGPALTDPAYGDMRPFAERYLDSVEMETAGKVPGIFGIPTIWQRADGLMEPFSNLLWQIKANRALSPTSIPFISWNAQTGWDASSPDYAGITTETINTGALDAYITRFADEVRTYGRPVFIRPICGEANGNWWRNCSPNANPSLTSQDFVFAWQRIVQIFNSRNATNVAWVWNMTTFPPQPNEWDVDSNLEAYYPGDSFVHWVGADHYDYGEASYLDPHTEFAEAHQKPFFLAEWGIHHPGSARPTASNAWLDSMFDYIEGHLPIKAIAYFNYDMRAPDRDFTGHVWLYGGLVNYEPTLGNGDSRLLAENGEAVRSTYSARIANARYVIP